MGSYYDIDAILTDAQKLPATFTIGVPGLGVLDDNIGGDIKPQTRILLPLWLGELLAVQRISTTGTTTTNTPTTNNTTPILNLDLPPWLSPRVLNALKADARTVDLRTLAGCFYAGTARCLELFEEEEVGDVVAECFKKRAAEIADHAHNARGALGEGAEFLRGLDEMERQLFRNAHESSKAVRRWMGEMKRKN